MSLPNIKVYVVGFAFSRNGKEVLLIQKTKPEWQAGKFNGIGGKVEPFEVYLKAMTREFKEETNLETTIADWSYVGCMQGTDWTGEKFLVNVYSMFDNVVKNFQSPTEEQVQLISVAELGRYPHIPNLDWLIPMALNHNSEKVSITKLRDFVVTYA